MWRTFAVRLFESALRVNLENVSKLVGESSSTRFLDLGCWDGKMLACYAPEEAYGLEINYWACLGAKRRGVVITQADLNRPFPLADCSFDLVISHQVIEHLSDTDIFVAESFRILKPGGWMVLSTENLASWHNALALLFGWQPFSLTNVSMKTVSLGNPLSNLRAEEPEATEWQHLRVFSYRGLKELLQAHGFVDIKILGAGYYPLPAWVGRVDPRHAAFLTVRARRPSEPRSLA